MDGPLTPWRELITAHSTNLHHLTAMSCACAWKIWSPSASFRRPPVHVFLYEDLVEGNSLIQAVRRPHKLKGFIYRELEAPGPARNLSILVLSFFSASLDAKKKLLTKRPCFLATATGSPCRLSCISTL